MKPDKNKEKGKALITPEDAWKIISDSVPVLKTERMSLSKAGRHVLSKDIYAPLDMPPFDNSAMDGYIILHSDFGKGMRKFKVKDTLPAGNPKFRKPLLSGQAYRVFTGALVPDGDHSIVIREQVKEGKNEIILFQETLDKGVHIRRQGQHLRKGDLALPKGHLLNPGSIGFLSGLGIDRVEVYKKPVVSLIITGDELLAPGQKVEKGMVFESNSFALQAALREAGIEPHSIVRVKDKQKLVVKAIREALRRSDLLLLTGGISAGDYDFVKTSLPEAGVKCLFYKIAQKPGKPLFYGKKNKTRIFALPGNPASVLTCFYEYVYPSIGRMMGKKFAYVEKRRIPLYASYEKNHTFALFLKSKMNETHIEILGGQQSDSMQSFAEADCLIYLPPGQKAYRKGDLVETHFIHR
jgi:molybdopterin molybdotransferase